jgi:hypothetical protein
MGDLAEAGRRDAMSADVLTPETVKQLRDAVPKDLLWLICDSHELLRAERDECRKAFGVGYDTLMRIQARAEKAEAERDRLLTATEPTAQEFNDAMEGR